ncbi:MAG: alpha/beta fold hydrolase [Victivallales bacterium]|nr:alpha/beta fold hydrolase [Victivallales bacterium]
MVSELKTQTQVQPGVLEQRVAFDVQGSQVYGILSTPTEGTCRRAVVFTHGWSGNRNGPAGILTTLSRALAAQGCACLRFDFRGRGESGGDGLKATLATMSDDLQKAAQTLLELTGLKHITLFGMCSGGNIAIGSLKQLPQANAMVMLSVYPFSDGDSFSRDVHRTWHFLKVYLYKACSIQTWKRLFAGEASLARVFKVIFKPFLKRGESKKHEEGAPAAKATSKTVKASNNESRLQAGQEPPKKYLANLRKDMPGLMIYGTADPDAEAALKYYKTYAEEQQLPIQFTRIEGANHNFSSAHWHRQLTEMACGFLMENKI